MAIAAFGMVRLLSLLPGVTDWLFSDQCLQVTENPLTYTQVAVVAVSGVVAIVLGEYGTRRAGSRLVGMVASVIGALVVFGSIALTATLATPSISCA